MEKVVLPDFFLHQQSYHILPYTLRDLVLFYRLYARSVLYHRIQILENFSNQEYNYGYYRLQFSLELVAGSYPLSLTVLLE